MAKNRKQKHGSVSNVRDFVTVIFAGDVEQARQYRKVLRQNEIPAVIKKDAAGGMGGQGVAVMVPEDFLDEAHVLIESQNAYDDFYDLAFEDGDDIEPLDGELIEDDF
jgi:hypothetical protein